MRSAGLFFLTLLLLAPSAVYAAWYDTNYDYCMKLTMTAGGGSGGVATTTTSGFALVATSTKSFLATTGNGGRITQTSSASGTTTPVDVVITNGTDCNSDGGSTVLDFYFEKYVAATGEFVLWVEPLDISSTTPKSILMYYGNAGASDLSDEAGVFGALGEIAVWNLHEDPSCVGSCVLDSTSTNADLDAGTGMTADDQVQGYLDGALDFDGTSNNNVEGDPSTTLFSQDSSFTVMAWFKVDSFPGTGFETMLYMEDQAGGDESMWFEFSGNDLNCGWQNSSFGDHNLSTQNMSTGVWYHGVCVFNDPSSMVWMYSNGAAFYSRADFGALGDDLDGYVSLGGGDAIANLIDGIMDDVRIYRNTALHPMDVLTIYNNTANSATFWTFGSEEVEGGGGTRVMRLNGNVRLRGVRLLGL